ncbi:PREDICTED: probable ATP-dependent RNA helicase ddx17 [Wasmannia auropunctata]|uniref:probable ATP-dependent RNA helicase ddx17 n=1 Tax=Wasmannia auropunctata TaxID=64793 RepID=UPI0005ED6915|nr:PREDICTED: probable ATP-dependent RNA helicase ddx17 [Wasmannia auropunctata]
MTGISMLLSAVIICCVIVANAEQPLNSYSYTGDSNGYDYSNTVTSNGYFGAKTSYQNDGSFYGAGDTNHKLSNPASGHSFNIGNQGGIGGSDVGNSYNGYSANDQGNDQYAGYSNTYENSASESYSSPTRTASVPLRGYIGANNNGESTFNAYSSDSVHKDSDFSQYAAASSSSNSGSSSSKRIPAYPGYSRPTRVSDNYSEGSADSGVQAAYHGLSSGASSYSESDHVYAPYSPGGLTSEYSFGKQKIDPLNLKGGNRYSGIYASPSETRYTRGNSGHVSYNRGVPSFMSGASGLGGHFSKVHNILRDTYPSGKPGKYIYKHLSRYAPNNGVTYLSGERDGYYAPYGKGSGKVFVIKNNSPSYNGRVYSDEPIYAGSNSYRSKSFAPNGYSAAANFDGYPGSRSYDDDPAIIRQYRTSGGPIFMQKPLY